MSATFRPNRAGIKEYLRTDPELARALEAKAAPIEARAKSNAPVESAQDAADRGRTPGRFRDSIRTERRVTPSRTTVRVLADSDAANVIERRDRPLGRAAG